MIRRILWVGVAIVAYVYVLTSGKEEEITSSVKSLWFFCSSQIKKMDLKIKVNKWPNSSEEEKSEEIKPRRRKY